jgi:hypothetical protein
MTEHGPFERGTTPTLSRRAGFDRARGCSSLTHHVLVQAEVSYRIKLLTPSGGAFIPITQTEMINFLTRLPMHTMEQYDTGKLVSIATTDAEKMDSVIVAMFMIITECVDIVLQVTRPLGRGGWACQQARHRYLAGWAC